LSERAGISKQRGCHGKKGAAIERPPADGLVEGIGWEQVDISSRQVRVKAVALLLPVEHQFYAPEEATASMERQWETSLAAWRS
jgi:hypothetical protein